MAPISATEVEDQALLQGQCQTENPNDWNQIPIPKKIQIDQKLLYSLKLQHLKIVLKQSSVQARSLSSKV